MKYPFLLITIIIILSTITGVIWIFWPFTVIGIITCIVLLLKANVSKKIKIIFSSLPILLIPLSGYLYLQSVIIEPEIYLIPSNYEGRAIVLFNTLNGDSAIYENGFRVYKFDCNGLCFTRFKEQSGIENENKYFTIDSLGNRLQIHETDKKANEMKKIKVVGNFRIGQDYIEFYVGSFQFLNSDYYYTHKYDKRIDSLKIIYLQKNK